MNFDRDSFIRAMEKISTLPEADAVIIVRIQNTILKKEGLTWNSVFHTACNHEAEITRLKKVVNELPYDYDPFEGQRLEKPKPIGAMLEACLAVQPDNQFLNSLNNYFRSRGGLTDKQKAALEKFYKNRNLR